MESQTTVAAQLVSILVTVVFFLITWLKDGRTRRWQNEDRERVARELRERLEAEARERVLVAKKVEEKLDKNNEIATAAHADIKKDLQANTEVSVEAFRVANGHNEKIKSLAETVAVVPTVAALAAVAAVKSQPATKVEVVNSPESPVPVTSEPKL